MASTICESVNLDFYRCAGASFITLGSVAKRSRGSSCRIALRVNTISVQSFGQSQMKWRSLFSSC